MILQIVVLLTSGLSLFAQNSEKQFVVIEYINGNAYREKTEKIITNLEKIDIAFMRKHFYVPYYFPEKFIDSKYNNETVVVWRNENDKKDFKSNWTNTYVYDSQSRVKEYSYSGCLICSNMAYNYKVAYDQNNRVTKLENRISEKQIIEFDYDMRGEIIELRVCSHNNELIKKITLEN